MNQMYKDKKLYQRRNMRKEAIGILGEKLKKGHISQRKKGNTSLSYIESHHAIREANRAFGFDGWSYVIKELTMVSEEKNRNNNHIIGYIAMVEVVVGGIMREDVGFGSGIASTLADAHEGATKEAVSDAMKRALRTFGDIFGLALYDKKQEHVEKNEKKKNDMTIELLVSNLPKCKTGESLKKYMKDNAKFVGGLFEKEQKEVIAEFSKRKEQITELGGSSQAQR